jgi:hypothetical protein
MRMTLTRFFLLCVAALSTSHLLRYGTRNDDGDTIPADQFLIRKDIPVTEANIIDCRRMATGPSP